MKWNRYLDILLFVISEKDVFRLQVAMDDARLLNKHQWCEDLLGEMLQLVSVCACEAILSHVSVKVQT